MLKPLLLPRLDNTIRGHKLALVFFGVLIFLKVIMSLRSITNGDSIINLILLALMLVGLALSLWRQRQPLAETDARD